MHQGEVLNEIWRLEHQLVPVRVEKDRHNWHDVESTKAVTDVGIALRNGKQTLNVGEGRASTDRLAMGSAMMKLEHVQIELETRRQNLQGAGFLRESRDLEY